MKKPKKPVNRTTTESIRVAYDSLQDVIDRATEKGVDFKKSSFETEYSYGDETPVLCFTKNIFTEEQMKKKEEEYKVKLAEYNIWFKSTEGIRAQKKEAADKKKLKDLIQKKKDLEEEIKRLT